MTALLAVAAHLPEVRVPVAELAETLRLTPSQVQVLRRFHGLSEVRRQHADERVYDLLLAAAKALDELRGREHLVRYVVYARAVPVSLPYPLNPVHDLCRVFGLEHAVTFTVTHHACATSLLAIDLAGRLLATDPDPEALALVVAGETVFSHDTEMAPESRVFGEGSGACLVSADGPRDRMLSYVSHQRGDLDHWLADGSDPVGRFGREYRDLLGGVITAAVERAGLTLDDIRMILPHNVNTVSWRKVSTLLDYPYERVMLRNVPVVGHTFAADAFINYRTAVDEGLLAPGEHYLVAAAGFGATFSAMVFQH